MKRLHLAFILIFFFGCDKENDISPDQIINCSEFPQVLLAKDSKKAEAQITKYFDYLNQNSTKASSDQQKEDLNKFITQINKCSTLKVIDTCFQCVYTLPPISELSITISANGQNINRTIDLQTIDNKFKFLKIHD